MNDLKQQRRFVTTASVSARVAKLAPPQAVSITNRTGTAKRAEVVDFEVGDASIEDIEGLSV